MPTAPDGITAGLRSALPLAMKARDAAAVAALRTTLAAIDHAQAVPVEDAPSADASGRIAGAVTGLGAGDAPRRELTEDQVRRIVLAEVTERREAAAHYRAVDKDDAAERLDHEADVLDDHLDR